MTGRGRNPRRTISIGTAIAVTQHVATFEEACGVLKSAGKIVVIPCPCRSKKPLPTDSGQKPLEVCFMFDATAQYYIDNQTGREVDIKQAIEIQEQCHDAGLVAQPATARNPGGMCNCCSCACPVLAALYAQPRPAEMVAASHSARVIASLCTACEACLYRCAMGAITISAGEVAAVNRDRCIGCGLCASACPTGAMQILPGKTV